MRTFSLFSNPAAVVPRRLLALICVAVLCTVLALGLWPFHSPGNGVTWLGTRNGLRFARFSTVLSSGPFQVGNSSRNSEVSIEIWLQPFRIWDTGSLLALYKPRSPIQVSLKQAQTDFLLQTLTRDTEGHARRVSLRVKDAFRKPDPKFITITSGLGVTSIYFDGVLTASQPHFPLSASDFDGWLVLGDSPGQTDSWRGQLLGLAIYGRQLSATQVARNFVAWHQVGRPELAQDQGNVALYVCDERQGNLVRDKARSGVDLRIPDRYQVIDKIALEPFWDEFSMTRSYWSAVLKNIVGFIPFGFCFYAYLSSARHNRPSILLTVALGTAASFTIEMLQAFLPTRESGTTDLITNTLGTWIGVAAFRSLMPALARLFPRLACFLRANEPTS